MRHSSPWFVIVVAVFLVVVGCSASDEASDLSATSTAGPVTTTETVATTTTQAAVTTTSAPVLLDVSGLTVWEGVSYDPTAFPPGSGVEAIARTSDGWVAVGSAAWHSADGYAWESGVVDDLPFGAGMFDVVEGPDGLIAVGSVRDDPDGRPDAAVWTSTDGSTWARVPHDEATLGSGGAQMAGVTVGGPGLVAVGNACPDLVNTCETVPTVWTSADGTTWTRTLLDGNGGINDVIAVGDVLIGVGTISDDSDDDAAQDLDAAMWVSVDAETWHRVGQTVHDEGVFGDGGNIEGNQWVSSIAARGTDLVAAGGMYDPSTQTSRPAIWYSGECGFEAATTPQEGSYCWTVFLPDLSAQAQAVAASASGFVVVGTTAADPPASAIWTSSDGDPWQVMADSTDLEFMELYAVATDDTLALVGGVAYQDAAPIWTSSGTTP